MPLLLKSIINGRCRVIPSLRKTGRYQIGAPVAQVPAMVPLIKIEEQYPDSPHEVASLGYAFR